MLFNIFINDVTNHVDRNTTINLFADDIKIYTDLPNTSSTNLQTQLNNIHQWSSTWQMQISYSKCNIVHIGSSNSPHKLHIHNIPIKQVGSVVDLGVTIDEHLRFKIHINTIIQKANQRSALIKRCFLSRNANNLLRAYTTYVRPTLGYASTTWSPSYITQIIQIESVQRHFPKIINGCQHLSYDDRLKSLKLQSLEHRRLIADLIMCYNIIRGHSCIDSSSFFTPNRNTASRGHPYRLSVPLANINVRNHFFSNRIISVWNSLPTELVMCKSISSFKYHLRKTYLSKFLIFATYMPN